jgi:hypothetical protein
VKRVWAILRFFTQFGFIVFTYLDIKVTITNDGKLLVNSPVDIPMGEYNAVIVLEDRPIEHHLHQLQNVMGN